MCQENETGADEQKQGYLLPVNVQILYHGAKIIIFRRLLGKLGKFFM